MVRVPRAVGVLGVLTVLLAARAPAQQKTVPPPKVELKENKPNPITSTTVIPFTLSGDACEKGRRVQVTLRIYNVLVQVVATPVLRGRVGVPTIDLPLACGDYEAFWDGRIEAEQREATPGIYYAQLTVDGRRYARKMIVQRKES